MSNAQNRLRVCDPALDRLAKLRLAQMPPYLVPLKADERAAYKETVSELVAAAAVLRQILGDEAEQQLIDDLGRAGETSRSASLLSFAVFQLAELLSKFCTCRSHSDPEAVYIEDLTCPVHGSIEMPKEAEAGA